MDKRGQPTGTQKKGRKVVLEAAAEEKGDSMARNTVPEGGFEEKNRVSRTMP